MRYDKESGKILIDCKEFVSIARRAISPTPIYDEDMPELLTAREKALREAVGDVAPTRLYYDFSEGEYAFTLSADAVVIPERDSICLSAVIDSQPSKPPKDMVAHLRGMGFVTAYVYAKTEGKEEVLLTFVYTDRISGEFNVVTESVDFSKLSTFFSKCSAAIALYAAPEIERVTLRLPSLVSLKFPYSEIRAGQSEFIRAAYRTIAKGGRLIAGAPTGTGKTVSALYPALRALGAERCEKIFYFTPKTTIAEAARDCLSRLTEAGGIIRAVILSSKERSCDFMTVCKEDRSLCKYSKEGDMPGAVMALYREGLTVVEVGAAKKIAMEHSVCPYELMLTYSELCDVVICDFNYLFDPAVYIRRYFNDGGRFAFLFDEAHNLPDRAQKIFSAEISDLEIESEELISCLPEGTTLLDDMRTAKEKFRTALMKYLNGELRKDDGGGDVGAVHVSELPTELYTIIPELLESADAELKFQYKRRDENKAQKLKALRSYYYSVKKLNDAIERYDDTYETFIFLEDGKLRVKLFCIDTGRAIAKRLDLGSSAVFFSATLTPLYYYKSMLGLDRTADMLEVESPFDTGQLSVNILDKISTRYSERADTLLGVCRVIAGAVSGKRGNYMVFSPSFDYSEALANAFRAKYPKIKVLSQKRNMSAAERREFLDEFRRADDSYLIGFSVMGGIYAEGIDLAGDALIGAIVVGIGMPALSFEREAMRAYFDEKYDEGMQFAYLYPGLGRVLQAGGRVIRREDDRGIIVLIDDRFDDPLYKKSLPSLWQGVKFLPDAHELKREIDAFWRESEEK